MKSFSNCIGPKRKIGCIPSSGTVELECAFGWLKTRWCYENNFWCQQGKSCGYDSGLLYPRKHLLGYEHGPTILKLNWFVLSESMPVNTSASFWIADWRYCCKKFTSLLRKNVVMYLSSAGAQPGNNLPVTSWKPLFKMWAKWVQKQSNLNHGTCP